MTLSKIAAGRDHAIIPVASQIAIRTKPLHEVLDKFGPDSHLGEKFN